MQGQRGWLRAILVFPLLSEIIYGMPVAREHRQRAANERNVQPLPQENHVLNTRGIRVLLTLNARVSGSPKPICYKCSRVGVNVPDKTTTCGYGPYPRRVCTGVDTPIKCSSITRKNAARLLVNHTSSMYLVRAVDGCHCCYYQASYTVRKKPSGSCT